MNRKKQMIDELIENSKSIDGMYFLDDGLVEAAERFETWIEQVTEALEVANMAEELKKWKKADDTRQFSPGGSFSFEINEANLRSDVRAMRAMLLGIRDNLDLVEVEQTPFLSSGDISNARKMSELYIILHCYENSVRQLVEKVLIQNLGDNWWEQAASSTMKNNVEQRKANEKKRKWLSVRGKASPLYYLEWGDLEKLVRKFEGLFKPHIGELRFIESRFGDLESIRHIVAHHGVLPSEDDFQRIKLSFKDWCRQVGDNYPNPC